MIQIFVQESNNKWYLATAAIIFTVVAIAHLALIIMQLPATIGMYELPFEVNGIIVVGLGYLAIRGFLAAHKL